MMTGVARPQGSTHALKDKYIVFFLENVHPTKADSENHGKDADTNYSYVGELPHLFGPINRDSQYKYAFGLWGPVLLMQSIAEMQDEINTAFDAAEKNDVPVYFQLDATNNVPTSAGYTASTKFYENPQWCEWVTFPKDTESWGGESYGRLPYYWFNWGSWLHTPAFPCLESAGLRNFEVGQLQRGVLDPLVKRYKALIAEGKGYLFAGLAVDDETQIPDYAPQDNSNIDLNHLPVDALTGDTMQTWEAARYGYNSLYLKGYNTYSLAALDTVIHDYSELLAKTANDAGIPKEKIFTHIVGVMSVWTSLRMSGAPPIWAAVNKYSIPGFTLNPVACPYNLDALVSDIRTADSTQHYFAAAEAYDIGVDSNFTQAYNYFKSMFDHGAAFVDVLGWGYEGNPSTGYTQFAVSHSPKSPFVKAAKKWIDSQYDH